MKRVFLTGERVYLRPFEEGDLTDRYLQWLNDPDVCRWNSHAVFPNTHRKMREYFESVQDSTHAVVLAILTHEHDRHIGNISLQRINWIDRTAEWAILIGDEESWGKGVATEAGLLMLEYGFDRLNLHRIYLATNAENAGMRKAAEKMGMKQEGVRRQAMYKWGRYVDVAEYGILRDEFYALRSAGAFAKWLVPAGSALPPQR